MTMLNSLKALPFLLLGLALIWLGVQRFPGNWAKWQAMETYSETIDQPKIHAQQTGQIEQKLRDALAYNPTDPDLQSMLANVELDKADAAATPEEAAAARLRAAAAARLALQTHPSDPYAWYQLANAAERGDKLQPDSLAAFHMSILSGRAEGQLVLSRLTYCGTYWDQLPAGDQADCRDQGTLVNANKSIASTWKYFFLHLSPDMQAILTDKILPQPVVPAAGLIPPPPAQ